MDNIALFKAWVESGKGTRTVDIKIGDNNDSSFIQIWVYDYTLQEGQFVKAAEEIDLEEKKQGNERKLYDRLRLKYEK